MTCTLEEISCAICISYFSTVPKKDTADHYFAKTSNTIKAYSVYDGRKQGRDNSHPGNKNMTENVQEYINQYSGSEIIYAVENFDL